MSWGVSIIYIVDDPTTIEEDMKLDAMAFNFETGSLNECPICKSRMHLTYKPFRDEELLEAYISVLKCNKCHKVFDLW